MLKPFILIFKVAAKNGKQVYENTPNRLSNLKVVRENTKSHVAIQDIFRLYWPSFKVKYSHKLRDSIIDNVESMISCKDLSKGHLFFDCPNCNNYHMVGLSCNCRFCASCGHKYREARSIEIRKKLLKVPHRHFVFSVPYDLRKYFWEYRDLFDILFKTVNEALLKTIRKSKSDVKNDVRLGFISFLHTSGRKLNCHPHLHVLLAEATIDSTGRQKNFFFFPFDRLRKTFMYCLLTNISKYLKIYGDTTSYIKFNKLRTELVKKYKDGFYTHGPKVKEYNKFYNSKKIADYIARYGSHPPIAESNILKLDDKTHEVTWTNFP